MTLTENSLKKAKEVREARQAELRRLRNGDVTLEQILRDPPEILQGADVYDVCGATPRFGRAGVRRLFVKTGIWPHKKLGDLTAKERKRLLRTLPLRVRTISQVREPDEDSAPASEASASSTSPPESAA